MYTGPPACLPAQDCATVLRGLNIANSGQIMPLAVYPRRQTAAHRTTRLRKRAKKSFICTDVSHTASQAPLVVANRAVEREKNMNQTSGILVKNLISTFSLHPSRGAFPNRVASSHHERGTSGSEISTTLEEHQTTRKLQWE